MRLKTMLIGLIVILSIGLSACGDDASLESYHVPSIGTAHPVAVIDDLDRTAEQDGIIIHIEKVALLYVEQLPIHGTFPMHTATKKDQQVFAVDMTIENTRAEENYFFNHSATVTTDKGSTMEKQFSADVDGDFSSGESRSGQSWWAMDDNGEEIETIIMDINGKEFKFHFHEV